jgi:hypothetical protein
MEIQKRTLNWLPRESAWDSAQAQREKRKANNDAFLEQQTAMASAFQTSRDDLVYGMAEITAKVAAARVTKTA